MSNQDLGLATEIIIMAIVISVILLFVGIGLLVLIHACIVGRSFRNNSANGRGRDRDREINSPERTRNMCQDELEKLPSFDFIANSKGTSPVDCAVCLENFKVGDKCRLLPICNHSFHAECVDLWLLQTPICPICRTIAADSRISGPVIGEESSHFNDSIDMRGSFTTTNSSHFSDASIDQSREGQEASAITVDQLRQSQEGERNRANSNGGIELIIQNQTNLVATQLSSNPS